MNGTQVSQCTLTTECSEWGGAVREYQAAAAESLLASGVEVPRYSWVIPACGNAVCVEPDHLIVRAPVRLRYPWGVCIYCGRSASSRDHLQPRGWTGEAVRRFTAIVPACGTCNSVLSDTLTWSITERRALAHSRLRKRFAKVLRTVDVSPHELAEFGDNLRAFVEDALDKKAEVLRMLAWPEDPFYDLRAMERSGIDNPYQIGLVALV